MSMYNDFTNTNTEGMFTDVENASDTRAFQRFRQGRNITTQPQQSANVSVYSNYPVNQDISTNPYRGYLDGFAMAGNVNYSPHSIQQHHTSLPIGPGPSTNNFYFYNTRPAHNPSNLLSAYGASNIAAAPTTWDSFDDSQPSTPWEAPTSTSSQNQNWNNQHAHNYQWQRDMAFNGALIPMGGYQTQPAVMARGMRPENYFQEFEEPHRIKEEAEEALSQERQSIHDQGHYYGRYPRGPFATDTFSVPDRPTTPMNTKDIKTKTDFEDIRRNGPSRTCCMIDIDENGFETMCGEWFNDPQLTAKHLVDKHGLSSSKDCGRGVENCKWADCQASGKNIHRHVMEKHFRTRYMCPAAGCWKNYVRFDHVKIHIKRERKAAMKHVRRGSGDNNTSARQENESKLRGHASQSLAVLLSHHLGSKRTTKKSVSTWDLAVFVR
ncbi:hypothetical protein CVT25_006163 [Psilocybe cyanescens]|uniref:Uncharacterized protein n=1 Tax=Psilocybe cyanescens TaxID=93625 RepID=A0A409X756_PSICY|nr:hypothetical protein CVT25_006163 [Psilocybe cyanescens]